MLPIAVYLIAAVMATFGLFIVIVKGAALIGKWMTNTATWIDEKTLSITSKVLGSVAQPTVDNRLINALRKRIEALEEEVADINREVRDFSHSIEALRGY